MHKAWAYLDAYAGHPLGEDNTAAARHFYLDEMNCSVQSPNKKDVVHVLTNGKRDTKAKRFLTGSVRDSYAQFRSARPDIKIGPTKIYGMQSEFTRLHIAMNASESHVQILSSL